jgi:hypothetical protein
MFVYCINNRGLEKYLTFEKKYEVINDDFEFNWYKIENDKKQITDYDKSRFIAPGTRAWREIQLKKLL